MTKNTVSLTTSSGVTFLSGAGTVYTGSGTPWDTESTSPYELSLNNVAGPSWVPHASPGQMQYVGGPPFAVGRQPLYNGYDNVVETMGLQIRASSKDNAVALLKRLRQQLNLALYTYPPLLTVVGGSNTAYFEVYRGDVQEDPSYIFEGGSTAGVFRTTITITRSATGGRLSAGESLLNATLNNRGSGTPDNNDAYSTGAGDLIFEGSPLNIVATGNNSSGLTYGSGSLFYVASILANSYVSDAGTVSTSSTTGVLLGDRSTFDLSPLLTNRGVRLRLCIETTQMPSSAFQARCYLGTGTSGSVVYTSPWVSNLGGAVNGFLDLGYLPNNIVRQAKGMTAPNLFTEIYVRNNSGGSQTYTMQGFQFITYYDWAALAVTATTFAGNSVLQVDAFPEQTSAVMLPYTPRGLVQNTSTSPKTSFPIRGTAPRYFSGSRFYFAAVRTDGTYSGSDNWTFVATHAPQYLTLRGGG